MITKIYDDCIMVWLSADDTYNWANRPGECWPGSVLSDNRLFVAYDSNGLYDLALNGKMEDVPSDELNACVCYYLKDRLPKDHALYEVIVGQFE